MLFATNPEFLKAETKGFFILLFLKGDFLFLILLQFYPWILFVHTMPFLFDLLHSLYAT